MEIEEVYYHDIAKGCSNCFHYAKWKITLSKCKLRPNWLTGDAIFECGYKKWIPNQRLYDKFEKA